MKTSQKGIDLIKSFEGFRDSAYKAVPTEQYYTIGFGHYSSDVKAWDRITKTEAEKLLAKDLIKYENKVDQYESIYHWTQGQFDACVSFSYNCGVGNFDKLVDYGKRSIDNIMVAWLKYNKAGGAVLAGLTKRRTKELELFKSDIKNNTDNIDTIVYTSNKYKVTASAVKLREGAGINCKQIGKVNNGDIIDIIDTVTINGDVWGKIKDNVFMCIVYKGTSYVEPYIESKVKIYSYNVDAETKLSYNFKVKEFRCKDGSDEILIDDKLVYYLQLIRSHYNKAVHINSGYRTDAYNKKIGGASKSYHVRGMAADIYIDGVSPHDVAAYAESLGILGIGEYSSFTHIDTRSTKSFWYGSNQIKKNTFK